MTEAKSVAPIYAVFGYPLTRPGDRELLGAYTSLERASAFVAAQDTDVHANLRVEELELDVHPTDEFWKNPEEVTSLDADGDRGLGTRLTELMQDGDLLPDDAVAAIEAAKEDERNISALRNRLAELEARLADAEDVIQKIANDPLEPSSQKHVWQITDHRRWCQAYFKQARRGLPEGAGDIRNLRDELDH